MSCKRILFLGTTGVDKKQAIESLVRWYGDRGQGCKFIDFEHNFLWSRRMGGTQASGFLDSERSGQVDQWQRSWNRFCEEHKFPSAIDAPSEEKVFLSLHACFIRGHYGVRCVLDPALIARTFQPDLIVTLISDVFDMWWRTEAKARGEMWRGQPTLEQLIVGRRDELVIGDMVASACGSHVRNLMLAISHPCETLANCINSSEPRIVYLSFPISEPRRMLSTPKGDAGMKAVSAFIARAYAYQKTAPNLVIQCPLGIDELPLRGILPKLESDNEEESGLRATFDRDLLRWDMRPFWPEHERLARPASVTQREFYLWQLRAASGSIKTDVSWRDYRLVDQAERLAVFNPVFNGSEEVDKEMSRGVEREIKFAVRQDKPVYIYQDPAYDVYQALEHSMARRGVGGTMVGDPSDNLIVHTDSEDELLRAVTQ